MAILKAEIIEAKRALYNHGVIAFPTETVMGLGVLYNDQVAYDKLNKIKRRPEDKPYTLMVKSTKDIGKYAEIDEATQRVIDAFMPGSLTILVRVKEGVVPAYVKHGTNVIGIRVPSNALALELLKEVEIPLLAPSANRSGEKPTLTSDETKAVFGSEIDFIVTGNAQKERPSTIVNLANNEVVVVREGPVSKEEILRVWKS